MENIEKAIAPFFEEYEVLSKAADALFEKVKAEHPDCVKCEIGCTECCYALFDLSLVEAIYLNHRFKKGIDDEKRHEIIESANLIDRRTHKLKRKAYKDFEGGASEDDILAEMGKQKIRCPLLNDRERCDLYDVRPITCRLYGIPTAIGGTGRTCGKSGFEKGRAYPTVHLDKIHQKLYEISARLAAAITSRYAKLPEVLMPVSMALLTEFNEEYLGVGGEEGLGDKEENGK